MSDKPAAGDGPGDVEAVPPEDLAAQAVLADGVEAFDRLVVTVKHAKLPIDRGTAFGRGEVSLDRSKQDPLVAAE